MPLSVGIILPQNNKAIAYQHTWSYAECIHIMHSKYAWITAPYSCLPSRSVFAMDKYSTIKSWTNDDGSLNPNTKQCNDNCLTLANISDHLMIIAYWEDFHEVLSMRCTHQTQRIAIAIVMTCREIKQCHYCKSTAFDKSLLSCWRTLVIHLQLQKEDE